MGEAVWVLMTEKNGCKDIHGAFGDRQDAIDCGEQLTEQWEFKDVGIYVIKMNLL